MADITPARKLFDLLVSRDFDPEMLDSSGKPAADPAETEIYSFDFRAQSGKDYGTVVIMLGDDNDLEVYCSDNVGRGMEGDDKNDWFAFLEQLKNFAVRNFMSFGIKNLNRLRYSMQGQAAIKEGLFESWSGNRTTSWNGAPTEARLMIRHKKNISEGDARYRYIESLFIETADSERYKLPFTSLTAGRAMLEHVRQGGRPYDTRGNHISEIVTELAVLSRFRRANQGQIFEGDTQQLVEQVKEYQSNLQRSLKGLGTRTGYTAYFESWSPAEISEQDVVIESLKNLFVKQSIDTRIESALPLLAKIQQQGTEMKEANIFEAWVERLAEGTWALPDTPEKQDQLIELLSTDLPVGADATNATEQLYDLVGDDELFDQLGELAERDANADARQVIMDRLQELSDFPEVRSVLDQLQIDATAEMNPPEATNPADLEPPAEQKMAEGVRTESAELAKQYGWAYNQGEYGASMTHPKFGRISLSSPVTSRSGDTAVEREWTHNNASGIGDKSLAQHLQSLKEQGVAEGLDAIRRAAGLIENVLTDSTGSTLQHILDTFKRDVRDFKETGEVSDELHNALYDYYFDDMPYGTKKARDGDPYEWVADRFGADLGIDGYGSNSPGIPDSDYSMERESVGDYADEYQDSLAGMLKIAGVPAQPRPAPQYDHSDMEEGILGTVGGGLAGLALGGPLGAIAGAGLGQAVTDGGSSLIEKDVDEGWKGAAVGGALGSIGGSALGTALGPIGSAVGGALGGTAGTMIGDKLGGPDEEQLNEVIGPAIAAGARVLMPLLSRVGPAIGRMASKGGQAVGQAAKQATPAIGQVAKQGAEIAAKNAVPIGVGVGAYQAITDVAQGLIGGVGEIYNDIGGAAEAITKAVGGAVDGKTIGELAAAAVKYAIPIGILLAVLYGGKKLIDAVLGESQGQTDEAIDPTNPRDYEIPTVQRQAQGQAPLTANDIEQKDRKAEFDYYQRAHGKPHPDSVAEESRSPLAGQYGHAGKMKEVSKDTSFLDRLKELSGMKK